MFQTRLKTTFTLLFLVLTLALSFLIGPIHSAQASTAPDFSLTASPTSQTIPRAQDALYKIHVQALNGFTGTVNLTIQDDIDHTGGTFSSTSVTGTGNSTLDIRASEDSPEGNFTATITGTSGNLQHAIKVTFIISDTAPDYSLSVSPLAQTISKGETAIYDLHVQYLNGFTGTVRLIIDHGPSPDTFLFTKTSLTGTGDSNFEVQTSSQSNLGTFTVTLVVNSGGLDHRIQVNYTVVS
ncbi:MAG: hypothetical protein ACRDHZ_04915 [Ktedonobacteraceae bacterium]